MKKNTKLVCLIMLAAGSLLLVEAGHALSGGAPRTVFLAGQSPGPSETPTAGEFVSAVIANELSDRGQLQKWICTIEKRAGKQTLTEVQVETTDGPLFRLLTINGTALSPVQRQQDDTRIDRLIKDPSPLLKLKQAEDEDELKLQKLMSLMSQAFDYEYDGTQVNLVRIKFRPKPDYVPPTYEARVIHSLAGTILIDAEQKRLANVAGRLMNRVEFGYGLLGRIDSGTVELGRVEVGPQEWKTAFINIQFSGRAVIFKTINKEEY
ncbi:MAG: hypothetical protein ACYDHE_17425, partial [Candidatus Acidiferrales bacterium]